MDAEHYQNKLESLQNSKRQIIRDLGKINRYIGFTKEKIERVNVEITNLKASKETMQRDAQIISMNEFKDVVLKIKERKEQLKTFRKELKDLSSAFNENNNLLKDAIFEIDKTKFELESSSRKVYEFRRNSN